jgi:hypothetical protein
MFAGVLVPRSIGLDTRLTVEDVEEELEDEVTDSSDELELLLVLALATIGLSLSVTEGNLLLLDPILIVVST